MNWHSLENQIDASLQIRRDGPDGGVALAGSRQFLIDNMVRMNVTKEEELDLLDNHAIDELLSRKWIYEDLLLFEWNPTSDLGVKCYWRLLDMGTEFSYIWEKDLIGSSIVTAFKPKNSYAMIEAIFHDFLMNNGRDFNIQFFSDVPHRITNLKPHIITKEAVRQGIDTWLKSKEEDFGMPLVGAPYMDLIRIAKDPEMVRLHPAIKELDALAVHKGEWGIDVNGTARKWRQYGLDKIRKLYLDIRFEKIYREQTCLQGKDQPTDRR